MESRAPPDDAPLTAGGPSLGTVIEGRYRIVDQLGTGGFGVVYRAEHLNIGRPVAIKVLQEQYANHGDARPRFEREARALAALSHPNVVSLIDYGIADGRPYLVMELLEGETLRSLIDKGPVEVTRAVEITKQLLSGLGYAHQRGLIHRDLKPGNVFLQATATQTDQVKVLDFGFVKFLDAENVVGGTHFLGREEREKSGLSKSGIAFGTPAYMAPEQAIGGQTDARSDVYAVGVLMFEMLTGRLPFEGDLPDVVRQHITAPVPALHDVQWDLDVSREVEAVMRRAMEKSPDDRFADANEFLAVLEAVPSYTMPPVNRSLRMLRQGKWPGGSTGPRPAVTAAQAARATKKRKGWGKRGWALVVGFVTAAVAAVSGATWVVLQQDDARVDSAAVTEPTTHEGEPSTREVSTTDTPAQVPAKDPWKSDAAPAWMLELHQQVEAGQTVSTRDLERVRTHVRTYGDTYGTLLLAELYMARGWVSDALSRYERAHKLDASVRGSPRMLSDLLALARNSSVSSRAQKALARIYGKEALPSVDALLARPELDPGQRLRLRQIRARLVD